MEPDRQDRLDQATNNIKALALAYFWFAAVPVGLGVGTGLLEDAMSGSVKSDPIPAIQKGEGVPLPNTNSWQPK